MSILVRNYKIYHNNRAVGHIKFVKSSIYGYFNKKCHGKVTISEKFCYICSQ